MTVVMFDMDGVLSDFVSEFRAYAGLPEGWQPAHYQLADCEEVGKALQDDVVRRMKLVRNFYQTLGPLFDAADSAAMFDIWTNHDVVVVTRRFPTRGGDVASQTRAWWGQYLWNPSGLHIEHTEDKVSACKKLGVRLAVEDSPEEAVALHRAGVRVYLIDRPYNRPDGGLTDLGKVPRVSSVAEFCKKVAAAKSEGDALERLENEYKWIKEAARRLKTIDGTKYNQRIG